MKQANANMGIKEICNTLQTLLDNYSRKPFQAISGLIMICSLSKRPGLSPILSTANIIKNVAARGINTAPMEDGSPNQLNIVINEITKEVFRAMREDANIQTAFGTWFYNNTWKWCKRWWTSSCDFKNNELRKRRGSNILIQ